MILLILLFLLLEGAFLRWGYNQKWGYGLSGLLSLLLLAVMIVLPLGYMPPGL